MKDTKYYQKHSLIRIFLGYFKPHRRLFAMDMLCALAVAAVDLAFPLVSRWAMNNLLPDQKYMIFFIVMGAMALAYLIRALLYFVITYWGHTFGIRVEADIRSDLFRHMQTLGYDFYDRNRTGQLMSRLTSDLFDITELAHHGPEDLLISTLTIIGALTVMFVLEWRLALVVCLILPILLVSVITRRRKMSSVSKGVKVKTAAINAEIESSLSGIRTAKAFANEDVEFEKFSEANERFKVSKREFHKEMGIFFSTQEFFMSFLSVAVIAVGGALTMQGSIEMVDLLTFSLYITTFTGPVRKLVMFSEMFANGFAGLGRFAELMRTEPTLHDAPDAVDLTNVSGEIEVDHVSFAYGDDSEVLHDASLTVKPGETVAIVGPSGGGKSTLCRLIPRFYDVNEGSVRIDGLDVRKITQASLHQSIGVVQQDVFLYADTICNNIRYGKPDATMEEIIEAAKRAEIYDDIMEMPDGFDTYVGERGTLLSGGQKQRVSIARIFLKNPPILILDEATSALDSVTEEKIQSALDALAVGRTTLIIAHRLSTIRNASRILSIADGRIVEQGSHAELMAKNGLYAELYRTQNLGEKQEIS
ncbi:MAG: ABC transporter ATP-binding protein [Clostridia bacterium]|nr:ABC transporter ATP-binding protein [Oscillospiraceae bacterium]MBQ3763292.1 ABC transporter ATP-binding protein [Clostridia bacterium]